MKKEHKEILKIIEEYLSQPDAHHLRFWQALRNVGVIEYDTVDTFMHLETQVVDDYNISDAALLKRIKKEDEPIPEKPEYTLSQVERAVNNWSMCGVDAEYIKKLLDNEKEN